MNSKIKTLAVLLVAACILVCLSLIPLSIRSASAFRLYQEGLVLHSNRQYMLAIDKFNQAIETNPNNSDYFIARGKSYYFQADFAEALNNYNKAIKVDPSNATAYRVRGVLRVDAFIPGEDPFDYDEALKDLHRFLELEPDSEYREGILEIINELEG